MPPCAALGKRIRAAISGVNFAMKPVSCFSGVTVFTTCQNFERLRYGDETRMLNQYAVHRE